MLDIEEATQNKAEELAEQRYGREFNDLPQSLQYKVWQDAEIAVQEALNERAEALLDGQRETHWDELELMRRLGK